MFIDELTITARSGSGGDGCMSFRREKFVPRGGPDGGDGGDGGRIIMRADDNLSTLVDLRYKSLIKAGRGMHGKGKGLTGAKGEDAEIRVPPGTVVRSDSGELIIDLVEAGQSFVFLDGGRGGRGNARFATSTNRAPRRADSGAPGAEATIRLELKLLADVGLVGFPNAGKSTLLSRLSAAHPKIADYPFTTLEPHLGIVRWAEYESFVMADLPGLIEGAHKGKGLGTRFLKHIERTGMILFLIDSTAEDTEEQLRSLQSELEQYNPGLLEKPYAVAFTKLDLLGSRPEGEDHTLLQNGAALAVFGISAVSGEGLDRLVRHLGAEVKSRRTQPPELTLS